MSKVIEPKGGTGKGTPIVGMDGAHVNVPSPLMPPLRPTNQDKPEK